MTHGTKANGNRETRKKNSDNTKSIEILDLIDYFDLLSIVSGEEGGWNIMKIVSHAHVERTIIKLVI